MSASYRITYLANFKTCEGSFKSDKQLINAGLIILSLGFFADFVEVLCVAKRQQRFSVLLGKDFHNASVDSFTLNNMTFCMRYTNMTFVCVIRTANTH